MGEWSKKIGEQGENIVKYFFEELIGFKDIYRTGISIPCSFSEQHKKEKAKKRLTRNRRLSFIFLSACRRIIRD